MATIKKTSKIQFSKKGIEKLKDILTKYPTKQAALLPALHLAQKEFGYLDDEILAYIADILQLPPSTIKGSTSFYTLFSSAERGRHIISVCQTLSCSLLGADHLLDYISNKLGIKPGQTTNDKKFTLLKCECLGACGNAPVMMIDNKYYENLTKKKVDQILKSLK